jgi:tetratricopeptide (TPR) repeat protein
VAISVRMIPIDPQERGNQGLVHLAESTHSTIQKAYEDLVRSLELASMAKDRYPDSARAEFAGCAQQWRQKSDQFFAIISSTDTLLISVLEKLGPLLPIYPSTLRFSLIRLSPNFMTQFADFGPDRLDILGSVISNFDRENPSVTLNLLNHVLEGAPNFYAALMLKGSLILESNLQESEAPALFQLAAENPPRGEQQTLYKIAALELLAESLVRLNRGKEAVVVYRRIHNIVGDNPLYSYHVARVLALTRNNTEALELIEMTIHDDSNYYSLSLIDDGFESTYSQIIERLTKRTDGWAHTVESVLEIAENIITIADDYELTEHPSVARAQRELAELRENAQQGSFTAFREMIVKDLPDWTRQWVNRVQETLQNSLTAKQELIKTYNLSLMNLVKERRLHWVKTWGSIWLVLGLSLTVLLMALQVPTGAAISIFVIWILAAAVYRVYSDRRLTHELNKREKDPSLLNSILDDINLVGQYRTDMLILLEKDADTKVPQK